MGMFEEEMKRIGLGFSFRKLAFSITFASFLAAAALFFVLPDSIQLKKIVVPSALFIPPLAAYFFLDYLRSRKTREIEEKLPAALFHIASFPRKASMERIVFNIAKGGYGRLSEEFAKADRQMRAGISVAEALEETASRNESVLLKRAIALLVENYKSGVDMSVAFKEIAEDAFELQALSKESASSFALQKYTLLIGGGLLVPVILALLLNIVVSLDFEGLEGMFSPAHSREQLMNAFVEASQAYLIVLAALGSAFVGMQEGKTKKGILYFALVLPTSMLAFHLVRGMAIV